MISQKIYFISKFNVKIIVEFMIGGEYSLLLEFNFTKMYTFFILFRSSAFSYIILCNSSSKFLVNLVEKPCFLISCFLQCTC